MGKPKIGFTAGVWDLLHSGHIAHFKKCKERCDFLIVGLQDDPSIDRPDKNKPTLSVEERYKILRQIRLIDAVIIYWSEKELMELEKWLPVNYRFRGIDHKGEEHYFTKGRFIDIDSGSSLHSSDIRKRICSHL